MAFDPNDNYIMIVEQPGSMRFDKDTNNRQSIFDYRLRKHVSSIVGSSKIVLNKTGQLFSEIQDSAVKPAMGRYYFIMLSSNSIRIDIDGVIGSVYTIVKGEPFTADGFDFIVSPTSQVGDSLMLVVSDSVRYGGGHGRYVDSTINIDATSISCHGYDFNLNAYTSQLILGIDTSNIVVLKIALDEVNYTTDLAFLGHYVNSLGGYHPKSPNGLKLTATFTVYPDIPSIPKDTSSLFYIPFALVGINDIAPYYIDLIENIGSKVQNADLFHSYFTDSQIEMLKTITTDLTIDLGNGTQQILSDAIKVMPIKNFRITNVTDIVTHVIDPLTTNSISVVTKLAVTVRWGYDDIIGTGSGSQFTITNTVYSFNNDELKGYRIQFADLNKDIEIQSNVGNVLQFDVSENVDGLNVLASNPSKIHPDADAYYVDANNVTGGEDFDSVSKVVTAQNNGVTNIATILELNVGESYRFVVRGRKGLSWSGYTAMLAGSYTKYGITQNYAIPFVAHHADISSVGADIGLSSTTNGFEVTISGWADATNYEICWTTDNSGADFNNAAHEKKIIHNSKTDIVTSFSAEFSVAVRPLIAGQQVAPPITKTVISGSSGLAPNIVPYAVFDVDLRSYTCSIDYIATTHTIKINNITSYSDMQLLTLVPDLTGTIITIHSVVYRIFSRIDTNLFKITTLTAEPGVSITGGSLPAADEASIVANINTSERGRRLFSTNLISDIELVKTDFDVQNFEGTENATMRVYQKARKSTADMMIISQTDTPRSMSHVKQKYILGANGDRTLVVDLYDPTGNGFMNAITGRVVVYGKPYSAVQVRTQQ